MEHEAMTSVQSLAPIVILACGLWPNRRSADGSSGLRVILTSNLFSRGDTERPAYPVDNSGALRDTVETAVHQASLGGEPR
jgi:hypothetical protein